VRRSRRGIDHGALMEPIRRRAPEVEEKDEWRDSPVETSS
jgi:hypothetical protein